MSVVYNSIIHKHVCTFLILESIVFVCEYRTLRFVGRVG